MSERERERERINWSRPEDSAWETQFSTGRDARLYEPVVTRQFSVLFAIFFFYQCASENDCTGYYLLSVKTGPLTSIPSPAHAAGKTKLLRPPIDAAPTFQIRGVGYGGFIFGRDGGNTPDSDFKCFS